MTDDVGWMVPGIYHQGMMVGETPNIDRIGQEGATFMDACSEECHTFGGASFITGRIPIRAAEIEGWTPASPAWRAPRFAFGRG
jgi:arylsulfatase A-like enzyme